jgi:transposase
MTEYARFVGIDQHKDTLVIAVAEGGRESARLLGRIANGPEDVARLLRRLHQRWGSLAGTLVCYEAGPCGFGLQRQLRSMNVDCQVIAPSLSPRKPGERVRTDKRDAIRLATGLRNGDLSPIWVPDEEHEALRDLVRAREAARDDLMRQRHRLSKFLLRQGVRPPEGVRPWRVKYMDWLRALKLEQAVHQVLLPELIQAVVSAEQRIKRFNQAIAEAVEQSPWKAAVQALLCFRGIDLLTAVTIVSELGPVARFMKPRQLMSYVGVVPSENSSGQRVRRGAITKTGNAHLRRVIVEAAWQYRHRPGTGQVLQKRQEGQPAEVLDIAWRAQTRLHKRYCRLMARGKEKNKVITAIARELLGFIWAALDTLPMPEATEVKN